MPIFSKDITVSVDANSVASKGLTEDIAGIFESRSLQHLSVNHSSMVDESVVLANTEELEEDPVPNLLKDIRVSVDANSVASKGQTKNIAGIFESRSVHADSNGILASNKDAKKMWIRGRLIEVKGE